MVTYDADRDAYALLGVDAQAPPEEIERAYRRAALTWHPDKSPAPDAAARFLEIHAAVTLLRDPERRRLYDLQRARTLGTRQRRMRRPGREPQPYAPLAPAPAWLAPRTRIVRDAVLITMETPQRGVPWSRAADLGALAALLSAAVQGDAKYVGLAAVLFVLARVLARPPHEGRLAWVRLAPGRRLAECHALNSRLSLYERWTVPFERLRLQVTAQRSGYVIELVGLGGVAQLVLNRAGDAATARQRAREVGRWLRIPLAA